MRSFLLIILLSFGIINANVLFAQHVEVEEEVVAEIDSLVLPPVIFSSSSASEYINSLLEKDSLWRPTGDTMKLSLQRLVNQYAEPFDSVRSRLATFEYDSVQLTLTQLTHNDTLPIKWLNNDTFIVDTVALEQEPFIIEKTLVMPPKEDNSAFAITDTVAQLEMQQDTLAQVPDTITRVVIDSVFLASKEIVMHQVIEERIIPPVVPRARDRWVWFPADSSMVIISQRHHLLIANEESPFFIVPNPNVTDSLKSAVETLLAYTRERDSILVYINNIDGHKTPFWLSSKPDDMSRVWVKNNANDSITIWVGNPSKYDVTLLLEDNINLERKEKQSADDIPIITLRPQRTLVSLEPLKEIPVYWDYGLSTAFILNQNSFSNWSKGGENSMSSMLDIKGGADYINKEYKSKWNNNGRLRYGTIVTKENGFRTNTDMLEFNSQYNKVLREKIDFSTVFYFKTQIAKGYKYPNDSIPVSRFLNPGTFTIGVGVEYKPFKKTLLNFSPLSYKATFVLDTANINQTLHGIDRDQKSRQEMGGQLLIKNSVSILDGMNISNSMRLFSGYLEKPENVDIDWEISIDKQISWYFIIKLNLHMIYDDDIRFEVEGSEKRVAKMQFKQLLGLTLSFNL